jgi:hypothetical protein
MIQREIMLVPHLLEMEEEGLQKPGSRILGFLKAKMKFHLQLRETRKMTFQTVFLIQIQITSQLPTQEQEHNQPPIKERDPQ